MIELTLRAPRDIHDRRSRNGVHRSPHRNAQKPVGYVHRFYGSTFV